MANASVAAPKKHKGISYEKWGYFFIAPFIIVYIVFNLIPLIQTFYFSFFEKYTNSATWEVVEEFVENDIYDIKKSAAIELNSIKKRAILCQSYSSN